MMAARLVKQEVLALLLRDTPAALWEAAIAGMRWAYGEAYASVQNDARVLPAQRPAKLLDDRFYLAERALHDAAGVGGVTSSGQKIEINKWVYTLVRSGGVCMVQAYVPTPEDFARPARFREQHAGLNSFLKRPQFAFGDVSPEIFDVAQVAGIMIHGPVNKTFDVDGQKIGFLQFAVPSIDYQYWELNIPVSEIVSTFKAQGPTQGQRDIAMPRKRAIREDGEG